MIYEMLPTKQSPHVIIDHERGYILIKGNLTKEIDTIAPQIIDAIKEYLKHPQPFTLMELYLQMYPESRRCYFLDMFRILEKHFKDNKNAFLCKWHSEDGDTDAIEDGEDFATIIRLNFEMIIDREEDN